MSLYRPRTASRAQMWLQSCVRVAASRVPARRRPAGREVARPATRLSAPSQVVTSHPHSGTWRAGCVCRHRVEWCRISNPRARTVTNSHGASLPASVPSTRKALGSRPWQSGRRRSLRRVAQLAGASNLWSHHPDTTMGVGAAGDQLLGTQLRIRCCQTNRRERGMDCGEKLLESGAQVRANVKPHFRLITVGDYYSCGLEPNQAVAHFKRRCA